MGQRILPHSQLNKKKDTDFSAEFYNVAKIVKKVLDFPSYKNQLINLQSKSIYWYLCGGNNWGFLDIA